MIDNTFVEEIAGLSQAPEIHEWNPEKGTGFAFVPTDAGYQVVDLRQHLPKPQRIQQGVTMLTVESFISYVNSFKDDSSTVFADEPSGQYIAVLDYHKHVERNTCEHLVNYLCPQSEEWKTWVASSGKLVDQTAFAEFIENNLKDIQDGATMMGIALNLQIHKTANFGSEQRLDNGQVQFRYEEQIRGTSKAGNLDIPTTFNIKIPVFVDGAVYPIEARFKYRLEGEGKLKLGYELIRHKDVWSIAVKDVTKQVQMGIGETALYVGTRR